MNFNDLDMETMNIGGSTFNFSGARPEELEETEYTIVNLLIDTSGSVGGYSRELDSMLKEVVKACKKSPKADNLLLRFTVFSSQYIEEHGYVPINSIDENAYSPLRCGGSTALIDATFAAVGSTKEYAKSLDNQDIMSNGIMFIITDGMDNSSNMTLHRLKEEFESLQREEILDSFLSILVGVDADYDVDSYLNNFKDQAGIDEYMSMGDASAANIAKLGGIVSKSISSQSQSLGTGQSASVSLIW